MLPDPQWQIMGNTHVQYTTVAAHDVDELAFLRKPDKGALQAWVKALLAKMTDREVNAALPLDIRATAFQRRVWAYLQSIPFGATRSYSQVAKAIGRPTASRAVARACATNPVAVAIPCHRVVREDGNISGYRWGVERKKRLLEMERQGL